MTHHALNCLDALLHCLDLAVATFLPSANHLLLSNLIVCRRTNRLRNYSAVTAQQRHSARKRPVIIAQHCDPTPTCTWSDISSHETQFMFHIDDPNVTTAPLSSSRAETRTQLSHIDRICVC